MRRTRAQELRVIAHYIGLVIASLAGLMTIPIITSLIQREWPTVFDFLFSLGLAAVIGFGLMLWSPRGAKDLGWTQGMVAAAGSWIAGMLVAAVPYYLSGHWLSYLDACFDIMSALTTTGLLLMQNLEHAPDGIQMWRHLLSWLGGQGMVVLTLSFFVRGLPGAYKLYVGEAKDERLMPNVIHTARAIWYISIIYLVIGTICHWAALLLSGLNPGRAFLHGLWLFMAGWSTGGFAPMTQNVLYYHSPLVEVVTIIFFILGSLNFNLHWALFIGNRKELFRNLEVVTFLTTVTLLVAISSWELGRTGVYPTAAALFRRGYYNLISAHTGTGFMNIYARQFPLEWGPLAMTAIIMAMLFGGCASSTAGGYKAVRIGQTFKAIRQDIRKLLAPEKALVVEKYHMFREATLDDRIVRTALAIIVLYTALWGVLVLITGFYAHRFGWDLPSIMFEAASATGNVGASAGVTNPGMPWSVKVSYIAGMWLGRLEFISVFVFLSYLVRGWRSR